MPTILVTGFEPFAGHAANPSGDLAKAVDGRQVGTAVVRSAILPVRHDRAATQVAALLDESAPVAVLHLGLAAGRARVALERVALNVMDYEVTDNEGFRAAGEPCVPGGPDAYFVTLPLPAILQALGAEGIPAYVSNTAGTYLCNYTLYRTLHAVHDRARTPRVGLVHVPLSPAMVAATGVDQPSMDLPLQLRAVETMLSVIAGRRA